MLTRSPSEINKIIALAKVMLSFEVCSFCTSIPLQETVDIAADHLRIILLTLSLLNNLKTSAETHFSFNEVIYDQLHWRCCGFSSWTSARQHCMGHHERAWHTEYTGSKMKILSQVRDLISASV